MGAHFDVQGDDYDYLIPDCDDHGGDDDDLGGGDDDQCPQEEDYQGYHQSSGTQW